MTGHMKSEEGYKGFDDEVLDESDHTEAKTMKEEKKNIGEQIFVQLYMKPTYL